MMAVKPMVAVWMAITLIGIAAIIGWGSPAQIVADQFGNTSCTVPAGAVLCPLQTITFATPFSSTPTVSQPCEALGSAGTCPLSGPAIHIYDHICILCTSTSLTWVNMPVASTILNNDPVCQFCGTIIDTNALIAYQFYTISVQCTTPSVNPLATLYVRYSLDFGSSWVDMNGQLGENINSFCPTTAGVQFDSNILAVPAALKTVQAALPVVFSAWGINGNGTGDSPVFNKIELAFYSIQPTYARVQFSTVTATSMKTTCIIGFPAVVGGFVCNYNWKASIG